MLQYENCENTEVRSLLDPRTKLLMVLTMTTVIIGGSSRGFMPVAKALIAAVPLFLYGAEKKWKTVILYAAAYILAAAGESFLLSRTFGILNFILVALFMGITRFMPGFAMGSYLMTTTTVSAFMASMERMHIPKAVTIPLAVTFRFFPTIGEEHRAINAAMRLRGISFGGKKPGKMLEYRLIPLMISCTKICDELSASALTRGLGGPRKRTNICKIGFGPLDYAALAICFGSWGLLGYDLTAGWFGG